MQFTCTESFLPATTELYSTQSIHKGHALSESCLTFSPKHVRRSAQRTISVLGQNDPGKIDRKRKGSRIWTCTFQKFPVNTKLFLPALTMTSTHNLSSISSWIVCMPEVLWWMDKGFFRRTGCEYEKGLCPTQRSRSHTCSSALECTELDKSPATDTAC